MKITSRLPRPAQHDPAAGLFTWIGSLSRTQAPKVLLLPPRVGELGGQVGLGPEWGPRGWGSWQRKREEPEVGRCSGNRGGEGYGLERWIGRTTL